MGKKIEKANYTLAFLPMLALSTQSAGIFWFLHRDPTLCTSQPINKSCFAHVFYHCLSRWDLPPCADIEATATYFFSHVTQRQFRIHTHTKKENKKLDPFLVRVVCTAHELKKFRRMGSQGRKKKCAICKIASWVAIRYPSFYFHFLESVIRFKPWKLSSFDEQGCELLHVIL